MIKRIAVMSNLLVNDFDKKIILNSLEYFDLINMKPYVDPHHVIHYIFVYKYRDLLFCSIVPYLEDNHSNTKPSIEQFILNCNKQLRIDYYSIERAIFVTPSIDKLNNNAYTIGLAHRINSQINLYVALDLVEPICNGHCDLYNICSKLLLKGNSPLEIYNELLTKTNLTNKSLLNSFKSCENSIPNHKYTVSKV